MMIDKLRPTLIADIEKSLKNVWRGPATQGTTRAPEEINFKENRKTPQGKMDDRKRRGEYYKSQYFGESLTLKNLQTMNDVEIEGENRLLLDLRTHIEKKLVDNLNKSRINAENPTPSPYVKPHIQKRNLLQNIKASEKRLIDCVMHPNLSEAITHLASRGYRPIRYLPTTNELMNAYKNNDAYTRFFRKKMDPRTGFSRFAFIEIAKRGGMTVSETGLNDEMLSRGDEVDFNLVLTANRSSKSNTAYKDKFIRSFDAYIDQIGC